MNSTAFVEHRPNPASAQSLLLSNEADLGVFGEGPKRGSVFSLGTGEQSAQTEKRERVRVSAGTVVGVDGADKWVVVGTDVVVVQFLLQEN